MITIGTTKAIGASRLPITFERSASSSLAWVLVEERGIGYDQATALIPALALRLGGAAGFFKDLDPVVDLDLNQVARQADWPGGHRLDGPVAPGKHQPIQVGLPQAVPQHAHRVVGPG
ncbi:hypothetical protein G5V59_26115 [Nocardioides sp. W3-2-3]|uniref:hypothetical protein n=1 Tax=Nocardioides convexus TaxID=2712224 RepID=UPI0024188FB5|nr:hypothetical protein [Nocardioides convexus]NHA01930.1 hypothetical protein [Nocardioides convexus]